MREHEHHHGDRVHRGCAPPRRALERVASRDPQDPRHERGPRVPVRHVHREQVHHPRLVLLEQRHVVECLERRKDAEHGGDAEDHARAHAAV
jgi:hypothetical protein